MENGGKKLRLSNSVIVSQNDAQGMENLNEKTEAEQQMNCEENQRLACQCKIKSGEVVLKL